MKINQIYGDILLLQNIIPITLQGAPSTSMLEPTLISLLENA